MTTGLIRNGVICAVLVLLWSEVYWPQELAPSVLVAPPSEVDSPLSNNGTTPNRPTPPAHFMGLKQRGVVTFLIHHDVASYFLYHGAQMGFEYELARAFAQEHGLEIEVRTPPARVELSAWLRSGMGDIAVGLATTDGLNMSPLLTSVPYLNTSAQVITRNDNDTVHQDIDLHGRIVSIPPNSPYVAHLLLSPQGQLTPPTLIPTGNHNPLLQAVTAVRRNQAAAMVVTAPEAKLAHLLYPHKLRTAATVPGKVQLVWAVRPEQHELLDAINAYLQRVQRSGLRNILFHKYFVAATHLRDIAHAPSSLISRKLSRYDHLIARVAEEAGFDWRLVAALIFEESRFDHARVSTAGASGLMQVTLIAARDIGMEDYATPHNNVEAGVKYLRRLARQFPYGRPVDRAALILASYVMGPGHVEDAQKLARQLGYDPHRWAGSMARIIPLLEDPAYYQNTSYGFAQGRLAVRYVNAVLKRYLVYARHVSRRLRPQEEQALDTTQAASATG